MTPRLLQLASAAIFLTTAFGCDAEPQPASRGKSGAVAPTPVDEVAQAPEQFRVRFETTKGDFVVAFHRDWSPRGADRVYELVRSGFYNDVAFFRVVPDFVAQFGMSGDPDRQARWERKTLRDDPVVQSNERGTVTFAKTRAPNSRGTQLFINLKDNPSLDAMGFAPVGKVVEGLDVVESINAEYGETPSQEQIGLRGNAYLREEFPNLDYIKTATLVGTDDAEMPEP